MTLQQQLIKKGWTVCIVCELFHNKAGTPAQIHHIRNGGINEKRDDNRVIPLCPYHHQYEYKGLLNNKKVLAFHIVGKARWEEFYCSQERLLELVKKSLY